MAETRLGSERRALGVTCVDAARYWFLFSRDARRRHASRRPARSRRHPAPAAASIGAPQQRRRRGGVRGCRRARFVRVRAPPSMVTWPPSLPAAVDGPTAVTSPPLLLSTCPTVSLMRWMTLRAPMKEVVVRGGDVRGEAPHNRVPPGAVSARIRWGEQHKL